jgi:superfamily II DNA helicase RecQ
LRRSTAFKAEEGDKKKAWDEEQAGALIADKQAGHTAHIAGLIYAQEIIEQAGAVADKR